MLINILDYVESPHSPQVYLDIDNLIKGLTFSPNTDKIKLYNINKLYVVFDCYDESMITFINFIIRKIEKETQRGVIIVD